MIKLRSLPLILATLGFVATLPAQSSMTINPSKDNTLYENFLGSLSNGAGDGLFVGVNNGTMSSTAIRRALVAFDVAGAIPAGSTIQSVQLIMILVADNGGFQPVSLYRVLDDWGEAGSVATSGGGGGGPALVGDATWVHRFFFDMPWGTPGGDFDPTPRATTSVGGFPGQWMTWSSTPQMVADVQSWLDSPSTNFGWMLRAPENSGPTSRKLASKESFYPPMLVVNYAPPAASITSVGSGCAGSGSGALTLTGNGLPSLGNASFGLDLVGGPAGAPASLFFADATSAVPTPLTAGCSIHIELASAVAYVQAGVSPLLTLPLDTQGSLNYPLPLPSAPSLAGFEIAFQVVVLDPLATGGLITSNALGLVCGN